MATATGSNGGGDSQVELDSEAKQLKLDQTKAEARKAIAEAQKATLAAQLPTPPSDAKPLEGKVDVGEKVGLVADLLAHSLINDAAKKIIDEIKSHLGDGATVLIIEDRSLVATDWLYEAVTREMAHHENALTSVLTELGRAPSRSMPAADETGGKPQPNVVKPQILPLLAPALIGQAFLAAPVVAQSVAGIINLFRSNYGISHRDVTIGATPLIAALVRQLRTHPIGIVVDGFGLLGGSPLVVNFWALGDQRDELEHARLQLSSRIESVDRELNDRRDELKVATAEYDKALAGKESTQHKALQDRIRELEDAIDADEQSTMADRALAATAAGVISRFDAFAGAVTTVQKESTFPPLVAAAMRERLHKQVGPEITHILFASVEASGGETITKQTGVASTGHVGYMGGCNVSYLLHEVKTNTTIGAATDTYLACLEYDLGKAEAGPVHDIPLTKGPPTKRWWQK